MPVNNYNIFTTKTEVKWPKYISQRQLSSPLHSQNIDEILNLALEILEQIGGPVLRIFRVRDVTLKCEFYYQIKADLLNDCDEIKEFKIEIFYESWMKENGIRKAYFVYDPEDQEANESSNEDEELKTTADENANMNITSKYKFLIKRRNNVKYYRNDEEYYSENGMSSKIPRLYYSKKFKNTEKQQCS